jgi:hypothetical protein
VSRLFAWCEDSRVARTSRLKAGCRQDCLPHNKGRYSAAEIAWLADQSAFHERRLAIWKDREGSL